jgi:hypothetical protein
MYRMGTCHLHHEHRFWQTNGVALTITNRVTRLEYATDLAGPWFTVTNVPVLTNRP